MATPITLATSSIFSIATPAAPIANDDSFLAINLDTGDHDFDVMANDTFVGVPTLTIVSQTGPGTATVFPVGPGRASMIRMPTGPGLVGGTKTVTYQLTTSGGSDTGVMTVVINAPVAVTLPLTPAMDFLASDGAPPANPVYVYDTNLGNLHDGSSPAQAKEIQAAINAATAGTNLVAIAAQAGGTTSYDRVNGLTFGSNNGTSGSPITLMARPGDTVIIDRGLAYAAFRTPSAAGINWNSAQESGGLYIWKSVSAGFGATRPLGGVWFEGGHPHYILPCDTLAHLQAPNGMQPIWTNYGGPAALVHTDGHIYVRWQIPYPQKMSQNNKWPQDHRLDYIPGWVSGGQLRFPVTQNPKDYSIWLTDAPFTDLFTSSVYANAKAAFDFTNKSWWTIGEGVNSFGYCMTFKVSGASNIEVKRGTDFAVQVGISPTSTNMPGPFTLRRRRMTQGLLKHQSLMNWKYGGPLEQGWRGAWAGAEQYGILFGLICRDCTIHGWHDIMTGAGRNWDMQQCTFIQCFDDGFQTPPAWFYNNNIHYCYFLDCVLGGPGQMIIDGSIITGDALAPWYVSHCIFDNRCPKLLDTGTGYEPFVSMPMMQLHMLGPGEMPMKFFNNTVIFSPDQQGFENFWMNHIRGDNPAVRGSYHEVFNCIYARSDYQRYTGGPSTITYDAWIAQSDEIVSRCNSGGGSFELYDYIILHRDVPNVVSNLFRDMVDSPNGGDAASAHGGSDYSSLANWRSGTPVSANGTVNKFNASKGIYSPGFFANSYQVNPQMPSIPTGGNVPSFDARRNYRPAASQANSGFTGTVNAPSGQSMASWLVKPSPYIGALDPAGTTCPIGVQSP